MTIVLNGTTGITTPTTSSTGEFVTSVTGFKNRILNGGMVIDQRATSLTAGGYSVDRWEYVASASTKATVAQSTTATTGFINSLLATSSSAYSVAAGDFFAFGQKIEGLNVSDLAWGTASAATVTLSFWVRSSLTGTFGGALRNSAADRSYPFTYTISAANTWEQKSVTIAGDTSGTWLTTSGIGIRLTLGFGVGTTLSSTAGAWAAGNFLSATGATSVVGTNGATFYITGVQLEKGSTATSFDYRPYGTELRLCQRYYYRVVSQSGFGRFGAGYNQSTVNSQAVIPFPVTMRTSPSALEQSGTAADYAVIHLTTATTCSAVPTFNSGTNSFSATVTISVASGLTAGNGCQFASASGITTAYLGWSAEL